MSETDSWAQLRPPTLQLCSSGALSRWLLGDSDRNQLDGLDTESFLSEQICCSLQQKDSLDSSKDASDVNSQCLCDSCDVGAVQQKSSDGGISLKVIQARVESNADRYMSLASRHAPSTLLHHNLRENLNKLLMKLRYVDQRNYCKWLHDFLLMLALCKKTKIKNLRLKFPPLTFTDIDILLYLVKVSKFSDVIYSIEFGDVKQECRLFSKFTGSLDRVTKNPLLTSLLMEFLNLKHLTIHTNHKGVLQELGGLNLLSLSLTSSSIIDRDIQNYLLGFNKTVFPINLSTLDITTRPLCSTLQHLNVCKVKLSIETHLYILMVFKNLKSLTDKTEYSPMELLNHLKQNDGDLKNSENVSHLNSKLIESESISVTDLELSSLDLIKTFPRVKHLKLLLLDGKCQEFFESVKVLNDMHDLTAMSLAFAPNHATSFGRYELHNLCPYIYERLEILRSLELSHVNISKKMFKVLSENRNLSELTLRNCIIAAPGELKVNSQSYFESLTSLYVTELPSMNNIKYFFCSGHVSRFALVPENAHLFPPVVTQKDVTSLIFSGYLGSVQEFSIVSRLISSKILKKLTMLPQLHELIIEDDVSTETLQNWLNILPVHITLTTR